MTQSQPMVKIRFEGKNLANCDFFTKSDPYLILSRPAYKGVYDFKQVNKSFPLLSNVNNQKSILQVRKTETIRNNLNPSWKLIYISMSELCNNDFSLPIRITVYDYDHNSPDDLIGQTETTLLDLMGHSASGAPLVLKIGQKRRGELYVRQCEAENTQTRNVSNSSYPERKTSDASLQSYSATAPPQCYSQPQPPRHMQQPPQPHLGQAHEVYRPHLGNQQPPSGNSFNQPALSFYQQPQMNFSQAPMNYQQAPITYQHAPPMSYHQTPASFQNCPQHSTFQAFPDDPTDQRPQSIWINQ